LPKVVIFKMTKKGADKLMVHGSSVPKTGSGPGFRQTRRPLPHEKE
jgi:hypothetical protein